MFDRITLHGARASLVWGYRPVAMLTSWRMTRTPEGWRLSATLEQADRWQCSQAVKCRELLFNAHGTTAAGVWELLDVTVGTTELRAIVGPPLRQ